MLRALAPLIVLALALPTAAVAQAPKTNAPPGNSAIDEYLETVPGAAGNTRPRPPRQTSGAALSAAQRARLKRLGPDGQALVDAVDATSPVLPSDAPKTQSGETKRAGEASGGDGRSPLGEVFGTVTGDDGGSGMGIALPAILIGALLAVLILVLLRRRAAS